ncbi:MAG: tetratricopeptide repeat protein [Brevundimonas sp.]|uniref:tetratricopeptide repeat protein n=1 Tax=Brevundimonas sp. TaxID=1871086 RepID=UPI0025BFA0E0|nr:tetratricopeptide repeat protein [Brevundimonas sp.]MBX3477622.1 tetratricopeptide repeat protein [Brevundimonas sp.]
MTRVLLRRLLLSVAASALLAGPALAQDPPPQPAPAETAEPDDDAQPVLPDDALDADEDAAPAVAETPAIPAVWSPAPRDDQGRSAYGLYLAGRVALASGEGEIGAAYVAAAADLTPEQPRVRGQALTASLLAGDLDVAARLSPLVEEGGVTLVQGGRLARAVQALTHNRPAEADAELKRAPVEGSHARAGLLLAPWAAAAAGDWDRALAPIPTDADAVTRLFLRQSRAALLEKRGRFAEAEAELKALMETPQSGALFRLPYGEFLERRGRRAEAVALYDAGLTADASNVFLIQARERAASRRGRPPAAPDFRQGAAISLIGAAAMANSARAHEFSAFYLRLANQLDPSDQTRLRLGESLARAQMNDVARRELQRISSREPGVYAAAQARLSGLLDDAGQPDEALAALRRALAASPSDPAVAQLLAAQLNQAEQYEDALAVLNGPLLNTADQPFGVRFLRGAVYEALDRAPEAQAELWAALQEEPDNAAALNYLGYLWVDSGERVEQGASLIAQALVKEPENGNFRDSLGWAQYRQGRFDEAVTTLEMAVSKLPGNPEINDHLGDAYWQVGRRREARYQWERVLTLDPDADQEARARRKLDQGLDVVGAQP